MTEHTPTPFHVTTNEFGPHASSIHGSLPVIKMAGGCEAVVVSLGAERLECEANAKFIVTACNNHDALVGAVKHSAISYHHPACKARGEYAGQPERYCTCHVQKARKALAALEGEHE